MINLPINDVIPDIKKSLQNNTKLIIQAPAGAGKSTMVPISLLNEPWLENKLIIVLEPRKVATRAVATQMAKLLGEELGETVGYQVKMESCFTSKTKILVVTEAILTRKLQANQSIDDIACVIFDEFHERSIHTDLSLALSLQSQELLRDDLKIILMSATLNSSKIKNMIPDADLITSLGKMYDVEEIYLSENIKHPNSNDINELLKSKVLYSIREDEGDILVFLAGIKEINLLKNSLEQSIDDKILILPLHSQLNKKEQDIAIEKNEKRKIILSTNIAQTSLTIEGVKVVIDSGLEKLSRFDHSNGMDHLELSFISKDSSIQRQGRAGRLSIGKCYKLWHKKRILEEAIKPEILRVDLSSFLLDVSLWGCEDLNELKLLDTPSLSIVNETFNLLESLEMIENKTITKFGKDAISLGLNPRLSFLLLKANQLGYAKEATLIASLIIEKDIFIKEFKSKDFYESFEVVYNKSLNDRFVNNRRAIQVINQADFFYKRLEKIRDIRKQESFNKDILSLLLLFAYPDRLAKRRNKKENKYRLSNSKGAILHSTDSLFDSEYLVIPSLSAKQKDLYINQAVKINIELVYKYFNEHIKTIEQVVYDKENKKIQIKQSTYFQELELSSKPLDSVCKDRMNTLLYELLKKESLSFLSWDKKVKELINKIDFLKRENTSLELASFSMDKLIEEVDIWLKPYFVNINSIKQIEQLNLYDILLGRISWENQQELERLAPSFFVVPSGSKIRIDYSCDIPKLSVKIQELFGLMESPKILNNKVSLQIHLLSPALRPIQITNDLKSFWDNSYSEVRKELRGKYKKHYWPLNPYDAIATKKTKKYM